MKEIKEILKLDITDEQKAEIIKLICSNESKTVQPIQEERPVVVFTEKRGVFFGYTSDRELGTVKLRNARNCYYWAAHPEQEGKGFMGLAIKGPYKGSKVSGRVPGMTEIRLVTCILPASNDSVKQWEDSEWNQ